MQKTFALLAAMMFLIGASTAFCDSPLPGPSRTENWSPDHKVLAVSDPDANTTTVFRVGDDGKQARLWAMVGWYRDVHICNDGDHLAIGYDGQNLIPLEYRKEMPMLYFVEKGQVLSVITLQDLIKDFSKLQRTVSHFQWGHIDGFNADGKLVVTTVEGQRFFDVTGKE